MKCPVCSKEYSFFGGAGGVYCSPACAEAAERELEELLERMMNEEDDKGSGEDLK